MSREPVVGRVRDQHSRSPHYTFMLRLHPPQLQDPAMPMVEPIVQFERTAPVMANKVGRPKKAGDRYPSGKLKPLQGDAPVVLKRAAQAKLQQNIVRTGKISAENVDYGDFSVAVYVMWDGCSTKIGRSKNIGLRVKSMQTGHDRKIRVFWAIRLRRSDAICVEKAIHRVLSRTKYHQLGEWYNFNAEQAVQIVKQAVETLDVLTMADLSFGYTGQEVRLC